MTSGPGAGDHPDLIEAKRTLRRMAAERRRGILAALDRTAAGEAAADRFIAALDPAPGVAISGYWPLDEEFDTRPLLERLHERGHPIGLPVVVARDEPLAFRRWVPGLALVAGAFSVMVPGPAAAPIEPELLVVPMLAFDRQGYRLGYGGGFYDRTLALRRRQGGALAVGLAFAGQEVAHVPHADYDQPLDWAVTEGRALGFA
jgi:5-formyltetrahydrofolate cyclo-ligase